MSRFGGSSVLALALVLGLAACAESRSGRSPDSNDPGEPDAGPDRGDAASRVSADGGGDADASGTDPDAGTGTDDSGSGVGSGDAGPREADADVDASPDAQLPDERDAGGQGGELEVWLGQVRGYGRLTCETPLEPSQRSYRVLLLLERGADGEVSTASVTFGDGSPPPTAEDPAVYYPPGLSDLGDAIQPICPVRNPVEGFEYVAHEITEHGGRLGLRIYPESLYATWCSLQTPHAVTPIGRPAWLPEDEPTPVRYYCTTEDVVHYLDWNGTSDEFSRDTLCGSTSGAACECDANGCWARYRHPIDLDVLRSGDQLAGHLSDNAGFTYELRLQRR